MELKVYADNDVVSTLRRWDAPPLENAAIRQLKGRSDSGEIALVASAVHDREAARVPEVHKAAHEAILALLPKVTFVDDHRLYGFNNVDLGQRGYISSPLVEDEPTSRRLQEIGLDRVDAHHVMLAIRSGCAVFVTCDERTILKYRAAVEAVFPILLMRPSEFIQRYPVPS
jgi:hypothetical protein